jgi:formylmethanofuran dehydrogenase subunit E
MVDGCRIISAHSSEEGRKMMMRESSMDKDNQRVAIDRDCCTGNISSRRDFFRKAGMLGLGALAGNFLQEKPALAEGMKSGSGLAKSPDVLGSKDVKDSAPVMIPDVSIFMRSPDSVLVGISNSDVVEIKLKDVLKFHGYCAGGVAFSFRAAQEAFKILCGTELPVRQSFKVRTSHHCCQAGALAYITGARTDFGAERSTGDMVLIPKELKKIIFIHKKTGKRVILRPLFDPHDTFKPLFRGVKKNHSMASKVQQTLNNAVQEYLNAPTERLFKIERT